MREYYLAHPFDERHNLRIWELGIERTTGINLINPFYDVNRDDVIKIDEGRNKRYEKLNPRELVLRDVGQIMKAKTGTIAFVTGALSYGTIQEMVYTKLFKKELLSVITNGHENHPWLRYHSDRIFTDIRKLEKYLKCLT